MFNRSIFRSTWRQTYPDDKNPLDEGEAEAADGPVASCDGIGQAEGQAEPDPVEQEGHWMDRRWPGHSYFSLHVKHLWGILFWKQLLRQAGLTEEGQHEDSIVANPKLIGVTEVVSGREFIVLPWAQATEILSTFGKAWALMNTRSWPRLFAGISSLMVSSWKRFVLS